MSHETIRLRIEKLLPPLEHLVSLELLSTEEVRDIIEERTSFEYKVCCPSPLYRDFADYIAYEKALLTKIRKTAASVSVPIQYRWMKQINGWVNKLYERLVSKVGKNDLKKREACIIEYVEYLAEISNFPLMNTVLSRALEADPTNDRIWMLLLRRNSRQIKDIQKRRALLTRATRMCPQKAEVYHAWIATEVAYVGKLISVIVSSEDQPSSTESIARLLPLEEIPACIFSSYLSNLPLQRIHLEGLQILRSFLDICKAPYSFRMMEHMSEMLVTRCRDVEAEADDGFALKVQELCKSQISEWEKEKRQRMCCVSEFIKQKMTIQDESVELEIVTDDEGKGSSISTDIGPLKITWETLLQTVLKEPHVVDVRHLVVQKFENFVKILTSSQFGEKELQDLHDIYMQDFSTLENSKEKMSVRPIFDKNASRPLDVEPEIVSSFLAFVSQQEKPAILVEIIKLLRVNAGLLSSPDNLVVLTTYTKSGLIDVETIFPGSCHVSKDFPSPVTRFTKLAWEDVTSEAYREKFSISSHFLSFYATRWHVLTPLIHESIEEIKANDNARGQVVRKTTGSSLLECLCLDALNTSLQDYTYAERHHVDILHKVRVETSECTVFCVDLLHRLGRTSRWITDKYCSRMHLFGSSAWKSLASHSSVSLEPQAQREWMYTSWLKCAKGDTRKALIEAYAGCLASKNAISAYEIERITTEAHRTLSPEEIQQSLVPACYGQ
ncbi:U3 small nucleolar RNA-associated protein 6 protein [Perkinsela sp. CCAP 1560/4]|nr:U3 small nucleolar RNA-associated protein 6 protein [Perkinsela sp. CCAP 1560/4]|eukprot:KNH07779.1 U3 small nucleolar RNA-associated protein 6 protein [Perkinsela sp. CCAP 1560/4]